MCIGFLGNEHVLGIWIAKQDEWMVVFHSISWEGLRVRLGFVSRVSTSSLNTGCLVSLLDSIFSFESRSLSNCRLPWRQNLFLTLDSHGLGY